MTAIPPRPGPSRLTTGPSGAGVNQDDIEMRSRVIAMLLPHYTSTTDLLEVAEWIVLGPSEEDDDA